MISMEGKRPANQPAFLPVLSVTESDTSHRLVGLVVKASTSRAFFMLFLRHVFMMHVCVCVCVCVCE